MPNLRVICISNRRAFKVMHTKKAIRDYIRTCKSYDKQMKRGNTYKVFIEIKI